MMEGDQFGRNPTTAFEMTENMPVGMFVSEMLPDGTRQFVFVSNRLLDMLGVKRENLLRDWREIYANIHPEDFAAFLKPSEESWNGITVFRWEGRAYVRGEVRWFSAESNPRPRAGGGAYWDGVIFDITTRKRAEAEAQAARDNELSAAVEKMKDLERAMKSSLMAAAVAHDVKQPLTMALFHAEQLLERCSDQLAATDARAILDKLAAEAREVADSMDRMRGLLQIVETVRQPFDLVHVCRSAARVGESRAARQGIDVEIVVPSTPVVVVGDAAQIHMAIMNLLTNAIEALEQRPAQTRYIRVEVITGQDTVECVVGDSGPGYEAEGSGNNDGRPEKSGGTGMGLQIVRTVLENHRGRLETGRSPLGGAEFRIVLPQSFVVINHQST